jgi:hypothetical protein
VSQMTTHIFRLSFRNTCIILWGLFCSCCQIISFHVFSCDDFCVKTTFDSSRHPILCSGFILLLILFACFPSFCSFISMFAVMLVCITSDLELVPSAWSKYFSFIKKNNYRLRWCIQIKCRSIV